MGFIPHVCGCTIQQNSFRTVCVILQLNTFNHVCCTFTRYELCRTHSTCRLSKWKHNLYYRAASNKVHNNKREITSLCRSNLIGCLQSTVPLRHLIKDYFLCTGSDIMCKQWVLQWVSLCISMCEKKLGAGAFLPCWDIDENVVQIQQKACDSVLNYFWAVAGPATAWFCPAVPASP